MISRHTLQAEDIVRLLNSFIYGFVDYTFTSHNDSMKILESNSNHKSVLNDVLNVLKAITEEDLIFMFKSQNRKAKSISETVNLLISEGLKERGWKKNVPIFNAESKEIDSAKWKIDFVKNNVSVDIAFNHSGNIISNLVKPVVTYQENELKKNNAIAVSIIITATSLLKNAGGFDGAVGEYERYLESLKVMKRLISAPILLIGLNAPKTFKIEHKKIGNKKVGVVVELY